MLKHEEILGVHITNASEKEILEYMYVSIKKKDNPYYIVTPNPEILVRAVKDTYFQDLLNQARISLPDGTGVMWAGRILRKPLKQRVTGTDLLESICKESVRKPVNIGFLGGREGVAEEASKCLAKKYPGLRIEVIGEDWQMGQKLPKSLDILFVGYGAPKQEEFMASHLGKIDTQIMVGVGGAFDYFSGRVPRAPRLIRRLGFEWLYRLVREPWRWKRQLKLLTFIRLVLKEKMH